MSISFDGAIQKCLSPTAIAGQDFSSHLGNCRGHHSRVVTASVFRAVSAKTTVVLLLVLATKPATKTTAFKPDTAAFALAF